MLPLTPESPRDEAAIFASNERRNSEARLYRVTDGRAIGTYLERRFTAYRTEGYQFEENNPASGAYSYQPAHFARNGGPHDRNVHAIAKLADQTFPVQTLTVLSSTPQINLRI